MSGVVGIYQSQQSARAAVEALSAAGFSEAQLLADSDVPQSSPGEGDETIGMVSAEPKRDRQAEVQSAVEGDMIPSGSAAACLRLLNEGKSLVVASAPFGRAQTIQGIMRSNAGEILQPPPFRDPSPLSDFLGIPAVTKFVSSTELLKSSWSLSSGLGMGMLSSSPTPLSSMLGMKPLSEFPKGKKSSFGLPLLSKNPAPLSSLLGMAPLSKPKRSWDSSFGFPLLYRNPAPLSALLGMPTLTKDD